MDEGVVTAAKFERTRGRAGDPELPGSKKSGPGFLRGPTLCGARCTSDRTAISPARHVQSPFEQENLCNIGRSHATGRRSAAALAAPMCATHRGGCRLRREDYWVWE